MRNKSRLLSSLMDLKMDTLPGKEVKLLAKVDNQPQLEGKRKNAKNCPIKISSNSQIYENFIPVHKRQDHNDRRQIVGSLTNHFVFSSLIKDRCMEGQLLQKFRYCRIGKGEYLLRQQDDASSFFILAQGELGVQIDGAKKRNIKIGEGFGELALLYSSPRSASIQALEDSYLWYLDRASFKQAVRSLNEKKFHEVRTIIEKQSLFANLTVSQKDKITSIATLQYFPHKHKICQEQQQASSMYLLKSGSLLRTSSQSTHLKPYLQGDYFGEHTMLEANAKWKETVYASQDTELIAIASQHIEQVLGRSLPLIVIRNRIRGLLHENEETAKLSTYFFQTILDCFKIINVKENDRVGSSEKSQTVFFVLQGEYFSLQHGNGRKKVEINSIKDQCLYGSFQRKGNKSEEAVEFLSNGRVAFVNVDDIFKAIKCQSIEEAIQKSIQIENKNLNQIDKRNSIQRYCEKVSLKEYRMVKKLGEGQFGSVFLVTDPGKKFLFALKCISKHWIVENRLQKHIINEREVLEEINGVSSFSVNYIRSYKDQNYIYFLMEFINGLELFDVIRMIGLLESWQAQFYAATLVHILESLHSKGIVYRDLKPENVMVEEDGYLKLIDMGTCKKIGLSPGQTFTIIGTPNYMAPEIIEGKGYGFTVDLWSLGVMIFEFMAGYVPFGDDISDPYQIYQQILSSSVIFPESMSKDHAAKGFIRRLLEKTPTGRLCGCYNSLKQLPFLCNIDWNSLLKKQMKPAFIIQKDELIEISPLTKQLKSLAKSLELQEKERAKHNESGGLKEKRKDLDEKWDTDF